MKRVWQLFQYVNISTSRSSYTKINAIKLLVNAIRKLFPCSEYMEIVQIFAANIRSNHVKICKSVIVVDAVYIQCNINSCSCVTLFYCPCFV